MVLTWASLKLSGSLKVLHIIKKKSEVVLHFWIFLNVDMFDYRESAGKIKRKYKEYEIFWLFEIFSFKY